MKQRFIKYNPDSEMSKYLQNKPIAGHLAKVIAIRARRTKCNFTGLEIGECYLGDYKKIGITEQQYRTAKKVLKRIGLATFRGTSKGTVAKLVSIDVWDLNTGTPNEQGVADLTKEQRLTKNVKNKELRIKNIGDYKNLVSFFMEVTGKTMRLKKTDNLIINQPNFKLVHARLNDGVSIDEMKRIIKLKNSEWGDDLSKKKWVRFETLFGSANCQKYLDEIDNDNGESAKSDSSTQPKTLEAYLLEHYRPVDLKHMKKDGRFERWNKQLKENSFKLSNIAKGYKNESINTMFLFEALFMPLGSRLGGANDVRKLESLQRWIPTLSDYNQNKGDMRVLLKERNKNLS